ncbi:MAG: RidA family protein [Planctomycetes bacterium]|nr:RidA family protein [Planctomycetota bacterium]NOG55655.1 RidA family protein [Planctomycetota bacterium]
MSVYQRLEELGLELPEAPKPVASYVPWVRTGSLVFISGQLPLMDGKLLCAGRVPDEVPPDKAAAAARMCALNLLAVLHAATDGKLDSVTRVVRLGVFVASAPEFFQQPMVANGASDLMVNVFGDEIGRHARAAVGSIGLPLGAPVEIEGLFEVG